MMATTQVLRKRKAYSILEKLQVVERIRKGETQRWLESSECATAAKVAHLRNLLHDAKADARKRSAQRKMTDFFTRK